MNFKTCIVLAAATIGSFSVVAGDVIWDNRPAMPNHKAWESQRYPIGNGRLGAMIASGVRHESIQFNVDSLWTGDWSLSGATDVIASAATDLRVGDYQNFGEITIDFGETPEGFKAYGFTRSLDLSTAVYEVTFNGVTREAFASAPADVLAFRYRSERPLKPRIWLSGTHGETVRVVGSNSLSLSGVLPNGLAYTARLDIDFEEGGKEAVIWLRARTGYDLESESFGLGCVCEPYQDRFAGDFDALKAEHVADYKRYYDRLSFKFNSDLPENWLARPTREKLLKVRNGAGMFSVFGSAEYNAEMCDMVSTQFNFGRYLLISSSRPGTLPANLQGLWCNTNNPPWHSDYHTNINLQMNYWAVDTANLGELWDPAVEYLLAANRTAERETRLAFPDSKGVAYRTSLNAFGGGGWRWNFAGAPWMAIMAYEHYKFTLDKEYLRTKAWPLLQDATSFMLSHLVRGPDGSLLIKDGWSPEHGPVANGVMHDQQIMAELLIDTIEARRLLGLNVDLSCRFGDIDHVLKQLGGNKIGRWGQLQEWQEDIDVKGDDHRHTSHLFAVYPGSTITRSTTPEFAAAAATTLRVGRTTTKDSRRSWTWPWRAALWARLGHGDMAGDMLEGLLRYNTLPNMFATHPPFQIDGNLGMVASVCEMLVQSHETTSDGKVLLRILPALPKDWPDGEIRGVKARGGYTVDVAWKNHKLYRYQVNGGDPQGYEVVE